MKIRVIQKDTANKDYFSLLQAAETDNVDVVCLGELATSGCLYDGEIDGEGMRSDELSAKLEDIKPAVMLGFPRREGSSLFNSYFYYGPEKRCLYDKINLFEPMNEDNVYRPGTMPGLFETDYGTIGVAICYDLRFPQLFMDIKEGGAQAIFVPAAFPRARIDAWKELLIQRAVETNLPVVGINAVGDDGTNEFGGTSLAVSPKGTVLHQLDETSETSFEFEIKLQENKALRKNE